MIDRLRVLLDRPLDPRVARAVVAIATTVTVSFAIVVGLAGPGGSQATPPPSPAPPAPTASALPKTLEEEPEPAKTASTETPHAQPQDPQDRRGTAAFHRAARAAGEHRALQHVPYRKGRLRIVLGGARNGRAILRVGAPTRRLAKRGWSAFLRRFHDSGRAYLPVFAAGGRR